MTVIDIQHGRIEYRAAGPQASTGPPVVFVHGLLVNAELWTKVADALAIRGIRSYSIVKCDPVNRIRLIVCHKQRPVGHDEHVGRTAPSA